MWSALIRKWDVACGAYKSLILRVEETDQPGCLMRLYGDGETVVAEILADTPQSAIDQAVKIAQAELRDPSITQDTLTWVQL